MRNLSFVLGLVFLCCFNSAFAAEGYRYMHVSIDTPWTIFLFLLVIVLFPFILMAILYWYFALKSVKEKKLIAQSEADQAKAASVGASANNAD